MIFLSIRWPVTDERSFRDLVEMLDAEGLSSAHPIIFRQVQRSLPECAKWRHNTS